MVAAFSSTLFYTVIAAFFAAYIEAINAAVDATIDAAFFAALIATVKFPDKSIVSADGATFCRPLFST